MNEVEVIVTGAGRGASPSWLGRDLSGGAERALMRQLKENGASACERLDAVLFELRTLNTNLARLLPGSTGEEG